MEDNEKWRQIAPQAQVSQPKGGGGGTRDHGDVRVLTVIAAAVLLLAADQLYLHHQVGQMASSGQKMEAQAAARQDAQSREIADRFASLETDLRKTVRSRPAAEAAQPADDNHDAVLDSTRAELKQTKAMTAQLQAAQQQQAGEVARQLAKKADQTQVGALSQDVSATRQDLDSTKKNLKQALENLGMTRTEFGTLIGRNHDEIDQLRQLGERDYYEFALQRSNQPQRVGGIGVELRKTDAKKLRYTLRLHVDDYALEKRDRTVNEPVFFYVSRQSRPLELVVNKVESDRVSGYLSVPKGLVMSTTARSRPSEGNREWEPFTELKNGAGAADPHP